MPPAEPSWPTVRVVCSRRDADWLSGELWFLGSTGIAEEELADGRMGLTAGFPSSELARAAAAAVDGDFELVEGADWLDAWRDHFEPVQVSGVLITPSWKQLDLDPPPGVVRLDLDPGRAFGTGNHASTRIALSLLQQVPDGFTEARVLDVGCGSGVLSIAALLLGAAVAVAIDIDDEAVRVTELNARHNGVSARLDVSRRTLSEVTGAFDVVLANILAPVLIGLAPDIARHVNGHLILAGLIADQVERVTAAYPNLVVVARTDEPPWVGLVLERPRG